MMIQNIQNIRYFLQLGTAAKPLSDGAPIPARTQRTQRAMLTKTNPAQALAGLTDAVPAQSIEICDRGVTPWRRPDPSLAAPTNGRWPP